MNERNDLPMTPPPETNPLTMRVKVVKPTHPHVGEIGRFTGKVISIPGAIKASTMAEVRLENCRHGTDGCFVSKGDVRQVDDEDQYV